MKQKREEHQEVMVDEVTVDQKPQKAKKNKPA